MPFYKAKSVRQAIAKTYRKGRKVVKKRYIKKGNLNTKQLVKDVMYLKSVLNPEKKRYLINYTSDLAVGQVNVNAAGLYVTDITPIPAVGTGYNNRNGASIKLHSTHFAFMMKQQSSTLNKVKVRIEIWLIKGNPYASAASFPADHYLANSFITGASIVDYNSDPDPDDFNKARLIRTFHTAVPNDQVTQTQIKLFKGGIKYNNGQGHHVRFDLNTTTIEQGQLIMIIFADNGNVDSTNASTLGGGVPITSANTGITMNYNITHYYYDN